MTPDQLARFAGKIETDPDSGCWNWTGALNSKGYPVLKVAGRVQLAHRLSQATFNGPLIGSEQVHHVCMNCECVNPDHIEPTTAERNRHLQAMGVGAEDDIAPF